MRISGAIRPSDIQDLGLQSEEILDCITDGVALLDSEHTILWANRSLKHWFEQQQLIGANIYDALDQPTVLGASVCPFQTALDSNTPSNTSLQSSDNRFFQV